MNSTVKIALVTFSCLILAGLFADEDKRSLIVPKGDASVGLTTFIDKGCYKCHLTGDVKLPKLEVEPKLSIQLGGNERSNWTRDRFAEAIMNPNHAVAPEYHLAKIISGDKFGAENSPMLDFNDVLTLKDLINLTTFLDSLSK